MRISDLAKYLAEKQERFQLFKERRAMMLKFMIENPDVVRLNWQKVETDADEILIERKRLQFEMVEPEEDWMYECDYTSVHGNPASNGKGHRLTEINGKKVVVIPGARVRKLRRSIIHQSDIEKKISESSQCFTGPDELESLQAALSARFLSLDDNESVRDLLGPRSSQSSSLMNLSPPSKPRATTGDSSSCKKNTPGSGSPVAKLSPKKKGGKRANAMPPKSPKLVIAKAQAKKNSAAPKGRGRPKKNVKEAVVKHLQSFREATGKSDTFYGSGKTVTLRHHQRLTDDLSSHIRGLEDMGEYDDYNSHYRRMSATLEVFKVVVAKGTEHRDFVLVYDEQTRFLKMEPPAQNGFPSHWHRARRLSKYTEHDINDDRGCLSQERVFSKLVWIECGRCCSTQRAGVQARGHL